jgi:hypothetical protein
MSDFMHEDPRPPDQRTPPPTPPPQQGGEPVEPAVAEGELAQVDAHFHAAFEVVNAWTIPRNVTYEHSLCNLMAYAHNREFARYPKGTLFTREQLLQLKPQHLRNWMAKKAFGKVDYSIDRGDRPIHARSSYLEFQKKAVSFFMPDNAPHWCNGQGNPTKHAMHRTLLAVIKKCEVRGEGADPKAKRALTIAEFDKELEMLRALGVERDDDYNLTVKYPAMLLWQYHLIGRIDDVVHFGMGSPMGHPSYDFAIKTKVQWSKNVRDEADCPPQILLGSGDRYVIVYFRQSLKHPPSYHVFFHLQ